MRAEEEEKAGREEKEEEKAGRKEKEEGGSTFESLYIRLC